MLIEQIQEWTMRHLREMIRQEKADDSHPILVGVGERQLISNLLLLVIRTQFLQGSFHVLGCVIRNFSS